MIASSAAVPAVSDAHSAAAPWYRTRFPSPCMISENSPLHDATDWFAVSDTLAVSSPQEPVVLPVQLGVPDGAAPGTTLHSASEAAGRLACVQIPPETAVCGTAVPFAFTTWYVPAASPSPAGLTVIAAL